MQHCTHSKAYYEVMLIQILAPTSNLPDGVNILTSGGLNAGYQLTLPRKSGGRTIITREPDQSMVFPSVVWCIRWSTLIVSLCTSLLNCESKLTTIKCPDHQLGPRTRWLTVQDIVLLWTSPDERRW